MMRKPSCLISCSHWLAEGSLSVLVGRHGAMKPAGNEPRSRVPSFDPELNFTRSGKSGEPASECLTATPAKRPNGILQVHDCEAKGCGSGTQLTIFLRQCGDGDTPTIWPPRRPSKIWQWLNELAKRGGIGARWNCSGHRIGRCGHYRNIVVDSIGGEDLARIGRNHHAKSSHGDRY